MASPQKENGYTAISNELFEAVIYRNFTIGEQTLIFFIIRKTYGFHKKVDRIALSQFEKIGFSRSNVCKILKRLSLMKVIKRDNGKYGINKNYEEWVVSHRTLGKKVVASVAQDTQLVSHRTHTKETITKENIIAKAMRGLKVKNKPMDYELVDDDGNKIKLGPRGKKQVIREDPFDQEVELSRMMKAPQKFYAFIGLEIAFKELKFKNHEQLENFKAQEVRHAQKLKGYTIDEVMEAMEHTAKKAKDGDFKWNLATVGKYISEVINK